jgi:hypothetical protein
MISLVNIAKGWYNVINGVNPELALKRLEICDSCEYKTQMNSAGAVLVTALDQEASTYYCADCGCPLAAKTTVAAEKCGQGKWNAQTDQSYY